MFESPPAAPSKKRGGRHQTGPRKVNPQPPEPYRLRTVFRTRFVQVAV